MRAIAADPECGESLLRELHGLRKYRVRRFRIVYAIDRKTRTLRIMAVGHRQFINEELTTQLKKNHAQFIEQERGKDRFRPGRVKNKMKNEIVGEWISFVRPRIAAARRTKQSAHAFAISNTLSPTRHRHS